jgi:hypothetical protein
VHILHSPYISLGKYVPELAELIHDNNVDPSLHINLQGVLVWCLKTENKLFLLTYIYDLVAKACIYDITILFLITTVG